MIDKNYDLEQQYYLMLDRIQKQLGDIKLLQDYARQVTKYFIEEYLDVDADEQSIVEQLANTGLEFLAMDKYKKLDQILTDSDFVMILAVISNEILSGIEQAKLEDL